MNVRRVVPAALLLAALIPTANVATASAAAPLAGSDDSNTAEASAPPTTTLSVRAASQQQSLTGAESAAVVKFLDCNFWVDNPHYSTGAAGVIAKVRYDCPTGNTTATLTIDAYLYKYAPGEMGPYVADASNLDRVRTVSPGSTGTVYVPRDGLPGIPCNMKHWYYGAGYATLVYGPSVDTGWVTSSTVHPTRCS